MWDHLLNIGILPRRSDINKPGARPGVAAPPSGGYGPRVPPTLSAALGLGLRALAAEVWLLAGGLAVALGRRVLLWPAVAAAWALVAEAAALAQRARPLDPFAAVGGVLATVTSPRFLAIVGGLWIAGALLSAALRVAWLSGALPVLGGALAGDAGGPPRFAAGVAFGLPRVLATVGLAVLADLAAGLLAGGVGLGAAVLGARAEGTRAAALLAAAAALGLVLALVVLAISSVVGDAAVARAALRQEGPGEAFLAAARRFLLRPGTFVLAALAAGFAAAAGVAAVESLGSGVVALAPGGAPALVLGGPAALVSLAGMAVAVAIDLAWLGTVAALACAEDRRSS